MAKAIYELVDELPRRGLTVGLLHALDWLVPGKYVNLVGFEETIRAISGETDQKFIQKVGERAIHLYNDTTQGYQRALWIYRAVDSVQGVAGTAAFFDKLGEDIGFLSWLRKLTPKADTTQAIDLGLKLVAEVVAFCTLNGMPGDRVSEFVESLTDYRDESLMRLATMIAADGVLPLGPDFIQKATGMLQQGGTQALTENERFQRMRGVIPGDGVGEQMGFIRRSLESVQDWAGEFVAKNNITRNRVFQSIEGLSNKLEGKLDYAAAFLDMTTDYFEHTGIQSIARSLVSRAVSEV